MSIQSVDDIDPTSSKSVFGSTLSQTKIQQPTNDLGGAEKLVTPIVNGQNDTTNNKTSDNLGNGTTQSVNGNSSTTDLTGAHVNGKNEKPTEETVSTSAADSTEKSIQHDALPTSSNESTGNVTSTTSAPTEPEPALSTTTDAAKEDLSAAPATVADNAPPVETTTTSNEDVPASATAPEATVLAGSSATPEPKSKSPRGKAKSPAVSTPPTRQSTRAKKPVLSSTNEEENSANEDTGATTSQTHVSPSPKRAKRQAATIANDAIQASNQPTSTTDEGNDPIDQDAIISDDDGDDGTDGKKKKTPSPRKRGRASGSAGKKRGASSSPSVSAAKKTKATPKGKQSITLNDEQQIDVDNTEGNNIPATTVPDAAVVVSTSESEPVQTPPKKARTSGNKKTPTSSSTTPESSGEYVRKLRPRTKDWRRSTTTESRKNLTWKKDLFYVEQPFRTKKNKKRSYDEAFNEPENDLLEKLNQAVNFCKSKLSFNNDESLIQTEHIFDSIHFADIATQQCNYIPSIHQIPLTDYFLRASKLGIQTNILYTHNKDHSSIIDTAIAGEILLPANCRFLWSDIKNTTLLVNEGTKYSFIVLDPPWINKSVRRKRPYNWSDFTEIKNLPIEHLIDRTRSSLICCWSTNCNKIEEFIKNDLFKKWNCQYLTTWYWLKVTRSGESVLDLTSINKKSYETLILAYTGDDERFASLKNTTKIICSVPALIHSTKPALHSLFQNLINFPNMEIDHCLEVYARNLLPNFTSIGNEVLKHQSIDLFEEIILT